MYLFFDTETTGLPGDFSAPITNFENWPRMVQLAFLLYDENGNQLSEWDYIIKPEGFTIPIESSRIHGITTQRALSEGTPLKDVLQHFAGYLEQADYLVAHNMEFDEKVIGAEMLRTGMPNLLDGIKKICTMSGAIEYCAIEGKNGLKWPRLSELHRKLFGEEFKEAHNAVMDIRATARCFWTLREKGII